LQIICISRYSYSYGKKLAEELSSALNYECISREDLTNQATAYGIPVGKLETAIVKRQLITEELAIEIERFKAFITSAMCERAQYGGIVYHGRVGHMVLQGLHHILRVKVAANEEDRISMVMQRLSFTYRQAKDYIDQVDEDRCRYIRFFYNINCNDASLFDIVVNSTNLSIDDSVDALVNLTKLREFQSTIESRQKAEDLLLQAKCRLTLGEDERTRHAKVTVGAIKGDVSVVYLPTYEKQAESFPIVLEKVKGLKSLVCTMATTNILYIQEQFNPEVESFQHLVEIAGKWNASVELVRLVHEMKDEENTTEQKIIPLEIRGKEKNGGILDDTIEPDEQDKESYGIPETVNKLIQVGRAGTVRTIYGGIKPLAANLRFSRGYRLVVVGDVFLSSGSASQKRLKRDLISHLSDETRVPVISSADLKEEYLFGSKQMVKTIIFIFLSILIYYLIFSNQVEVLKFLSASGTSFKILVVAVIALFVPLVAFIISGFWHNIMKLVKLE